MPTSHKLVFSSLCWLSIGSILVVAHPQAKESSSYNDDIKRNNPSPNDLFWANRGKKSEMPINVADADFQLGKDRMRRSLKVLRPNSFMNLYMPKEERGKRGGNLRALRPNSFLFPSIQGEKRAHFHQGLRPNSHLFPSVLKGKRSGDLKSMRPNSFLFPIPKRSSTFFAGRGKKSQSGWGNALDTDDMESFFAGRGRRYDSDEGDEMEEDADYDLVMDKRDHFIDDEDAMDSFFAGRGKKSGSFFAGRGKREISKKDAQDEDRVFWAVRG
eukprot:maker-scaffold1414_size42706-snap-gene-0.12 protein:Tk10777 transcript:maker-scaffold1414_size42706-snap-gene-0.12-mRNA-1 annotation:"hypothetical protein CNAG_00563"